MAKFMPRIMVVEPTTTTPAVWENMAEEPFASYSCANDVIRRARRRAKLMDEPAPFCRMEKIKT
jgi:hypothetical protein